MPETSFLQPVRRSLARPLLEELERRRLLSTYTLADLGTLGGVDSRALALNGAGEVAGIASGHAYHWHGGALTDLGVLPGTTTSLANGINNAGQVVGSSSPDPYGSSSVAFRWQDGVMTDLGLGNQSSAAAINDAGQIVGSMDGRAFLWQDGTVTDLGNLGSPGAGAADINYAGQVVGWAYTDQVAMFGMMSHAFIWQDGVMTDLGTPPFTQGAYASAVNNLGQVVGQTSVWLNTGYGAAMVSRSFFYDGHTMAMLPVPGITNLALDINDAGQIVGTMAGRAYLYEDGVVKDLNTLLPPGPNPVLAGATAINNAGQIVGYTSAGHAFLLNPVAPPAAQVLRADFDWRGGAQRLTFQFSGDASGQVSLADLVLQNADTGAAVDPAAVAMSYDRASHTATFTFPGYSGGTLPNGNYRATLAPPGVQSASARVVAAGASLEFFVLAGDVNRDRMVNGADFATLAGNFGRTGMTFEQGDLNGDGSINGGDFALLAASFGRTVPAAAAPVALKQSTAQVSAPRVLASAPQRRPSRTALRAPQRTASLQRPRRLLRP
jgi:probable HAF family extracellular repeat protein